MKSRCFNKNDPAYKNYGGRGISMCESWVLSFEEFFLHMGPRPSSKHSIDRYPDNNGNYDPGNCRWATDIEQANNKRNNFMIAVDGETMTASGWSLRTGISQKTIKLRIVRYGWTPREAVGIDPRPHRRSALFGEYERRTS
jgi:hypothetical protein